MEENSPSRRRKFSAFAFLLLKITALTLFSFYLVDFLAYHSTLRHAKDVNIGDSRDAVVEALGKPAMEYFADADYGTFLTVDYGYDWWAYGKTFTLKDAFFLEPPFFFPLRFRFAMQQSDDVVIEFDSDGKVMNILMPGKTSSESWTQ